MKSGRRGLVVGTIALAFMAPQTAHAADVLLEAEDAAGDVRVFKAKGLGKSARRSIDLRAAWVSEVDERTYRLTVKVQRVAAKRTRWDQMVFFQADSPSKANHDYAMIGFTHQQNDGAYAYDSKADNWCNFERIIRRPAKGTLSVDVPLRCMPWDGWKMKVSTYTGTFRSDAPVFSRDRKVLGDFYYPL